MFPYLKFDPSSVLFTNSKIYQPFPYLKFDPSSVLSAHLLHLHSKYLLSLRCCRRHTVPANACV